MIFSNLYLLIGEKNLSKLAKDVKKFNVYDKLEGTKIPISIKTLSGTEYCLTFRPS